MEQGQVIDLHEQNIPSDEGEARPVLGNIREDWDHIRPCLDSLLATCPDLSFRVEDVYAEVVAEQAVYWKAPEGFVVSTTEVDQLQVKRLS